MYTYIFLAADVILVIVMALLTNKHINLPLWKVVVFSLAVVPVGLFCAKLMRQIEAGTWSGNSLYGAILFEPVLMILFGLLIGIKPKDILDLGAPAGCISIVFMKIQCKITGCCAGKILRYQANGRPVRFPSQIVEMLVGAVLLIIIMMIIRSGKYKGYVYAWFLVLYGGTRFFLNLLRETEPFILGLSAGCFWSIIAVAIGGTVLLLRSRKGEKGNA